MAGPSRIRTGFHHLTTVPEPNGDGSYAARCARTRCRRPLPRCAAPVRSCRRRHCPPARARWPRVEPLPRDGVRSCRTIRPAVRAADVTRQPAASRLGRAAAGRVRRRRRGARDAAVSNPRAGAQHRRGAGCVARFPGAATGFGDRRHAVVGVIVGAMDLRAGRRGRDAARGAGRCRVRSRRGR